MPWAAKKGMVLYAVTSCPPPWELVLTNRPAGFPTSSPLTHSWPVASKRAFTCAGMMPKLRARAGGSSCQRSGPPHGAGHRHAASSPAMAGSASAPGAEAEQEPVRLG